MYVMRALSILLFLRFRCLYGSFLLHQIRPADVGTIAVNHKSVLTALIIFLISISAFCQEADETDKVLYDKNGVPLLDCKAACLMDADTGQVLYKKNPYLHLPNASTTKLMTCILVLQNLSLDDMLTASENTVNTPYTSIYLQKGERISVKDALAGAIIKSANDTCVLLAEAVGGNTRRFSQMMNEKAAELGMMDTHFVNPHGLYDKNHYSSAYDMCLLGKEALKYPEISGLAMTRKYVLDSRTENKEAALIFNKTKFTRDYPYATGLKPGYTKQSGNCLVGSAEKNGVRLVSCVLNSGRMTDETIALMEYGFNNFQKEIIIPKTEFFKEYNVANASGKVAGMLSGDLSYLMPKHEKSKKYEYKFIVSNELRAPIKKGDRIGKAKAFIGLHEVAGVDIIAAEDVEPDAIRSAGILFAGVGLFLWKLLKIAFIALICILIVAGVIASGRKIAENHGKSGPGFKKKMRRNNTVGKRHSRRTKSLFRPESRPGNKRYQSVGRSGFRKQD